MKEKSEIKQQPFKVGDKVFDIALQEKGRVESAEKGKLIEVQFDTTIKFYNHEGISDIGDITPQLLHWDEAYNYLNPDFNNLPKKKRWRAKKHYKYYCIITNMGDFEIYRTYESDREFDRSRYKRHNYFRTQEEAEQALEKIKELLINLNK